jgi:hypothetical protein
VVGLMVPWSRRSRAWDGVMVLRRSNRAWVSVREGCEGLACCWDGLFGPCMGGLLIFDV